jgi:hypothetical protein
VASLEQIVTLNQEQEVSETHPLTERSCQQFARYFSRYEACARAGSLGKLDAVDRVLFESGAETSLLKAVSLQA